MTRTQSGLERNLRTDPPKAVDDIRNIRRLLDEGEVMEAFDADVRRRFGVMISTALKKAKKPRH